MNKVLSIILFFSPIYLSAQNWNVFNKNYRYNYKYDNSVLVSQVLFADSIKQSGSDTIYFMNRVGASYTGSAPTITASINPTLTVIVHNLPQFLQRKIIKHPNRLVSFRDTAKLVINPDVQPSQSWLFDSVNNISATCINKILQNIFGQPDSIKTILLNGIDTLKLSKQFGIIQYPELYNKNKYFRLAGIESTLSYDSVSLFGEKVPNAWDFYKFGITDRFCHKGSTVYTTGTPYNYPWATLIHVNSRTVTATGYLYTIYHPTSNAYILNYSNLNMKIVENIMYPGKIISSSHHPQIPIESSLLNIYNIVRFGTDQQGRFYKAAGPTCPGMLIIDIGNYQVFPGMMMWMNMQGYLESSPASGLLSEIYGVGMGSIHRKLWRAGEQYDNCLICAPKNGSGIFGTPEALSVGEGDVGTFKLYPNPSTGILFLEADDLKGVNCKVKSILGGEVNASFQVDSSTKHSIDLSSQTPGIYFLQIFKGGALISNIKIIRE